MPGDRILIFSWNDLTFDIESELIKRGHYVSSALRVPRKDINSYDLILHWNENPIADTRNFIKYIKSRGKKVVIYQHGRRAIPRTYEPYNEPLIADKVFVWGKSAKDKLISGGTPEDKIVITGSPVFKKLRPRKEHKGKNLLFIPIHWEKDNIENQIVVSTLRKLKGVNIRTKILNTEHNPEDFDNPIISDRRLGGHWDLIAELLQDIDIVVSMNDSTLSMAAEYLDIPVVVPDIIIEGIHTADHMENQRVFSNACKVVKLDDLNETIYQQLKNPQELSKERQQSCIDDGGADIKDPIKLFCDEIEKI